MGLFQFWSIFLDSEAIDIQEESANVVCLISKFDVCRGGLSNAGR